MALQSAMADTNVALASARDLSELLATAFGPQGRAVLFQNPTGQMTITRSGCNILKCICLDSDAPQRKILMNCAENVQGTFGDGVKSFVIITTGILRSFSTLKAPSRVVMQLSKIQSRLAQISLCSNLESFDICPYLQVIRTFFYTRFPSPVSSVLSPLMHDFISKFCCLCTSKTSKQDSTASLESMYQDFAILCRYQDNPARSVSDSCVSTGFTLSRRAASTLRPGPKRLAVFMFEDSDSNDGKFDDLDVKCEMERFLVDLRQNAAVSENILLVTPVILSDLTLFNLRRENVAVVHGAPIDEVKYLSRIASVFPCVVIVGIERNTENVSLQIPSVHQLCIHGPSKELREEYAGTCRGALKLLIETDKPAMRNIFIKGRGHFEQTLCQYMTKKLDRPKDYLPKLKNRAELLKWHGQKSRGVGDEEIDNVIYQRIVEAFVGIDSDVIESVIEGLLEIPRRLNVSSEQLEPLEPLALRIGVLNHAIGAVITLMRIDQVLISNSKTSVQLH